MESITSQRVDTVDCAKLIRRDLARHFPGIKFSVRSSRYSGGSSIDVGWTDGPTTKQVSPIAKRYQGASFDGMTDMKEYHEDLVLQPDGIVKTVHYGADYVFSTRSYSQPDAFRETIAKRCCADFDGLTYEPGWGNLRWGNDWLSSIVECILSAVDFRTMSPETVPLIKDSMINGRI